MLVASYWPHIGAQSQFCPYCPFILEYPHRPSFGPKDIMANTMLAGCYRCGDSSHGESQQHSIPFPPLIIVAYATYHCFECLKHTFLCDGSCLVSKYPRNSGTVRRYNGCYHRRMESLMKHLKLKHIPLSEYNHSEDVDFNLEIPEVPSEPPFLFGGKESQQFSTTTRHHGLRHAIIEIFDRSANQQNDHHDALSSLCPESINLYFAISTIVLSAGKALPAALTLVVSSVWRFLPHNDENWLATPRTSRDFGSTILNRTNQNSLFNLLPIPSVTPLDDGIHAYVPIDELISFS
jgi:hypothetical protein